MPRLSQRPHPFDTLDEHQIILSTIHYFSEHYPEPLTIPSISTALGISLLNLETAFDHYKGKTANQALLEYRLNRLCDKMSLDPSAEIGQQISDCGLTAFPKTNIYFTDHFGIDLVEFHRQCFISALDRLASNKSMGTSQGDELVGGKCSGNRLLTRFHRHEHG